ncbi:DUF3311 domain-containing protein [Thermopolyspora sp. NPDC052614]|uniref:DUF3311 domain-containing protein n=1 Tax=Thermopolyspora sp. NPDC052614 TaxID=3155682 RepID=UPI00342DAE5B
MTTTGSDRPGATPPARHRDRSPWNWLLLVPIVVPLIPALYNGVDPRIGGFPRFYWLQLAFVLLGIAATTTVYLMTRKRPGDRGGPHE